MRRYAGVMRWLGVLVLGGWIGVASAADRPAVDLGISSWIGYGPIFVAEQKGFFAKEGVDVTLHRIEKAANRRSALASGAIDGFPTTPDTFVSTAAAHLPVVQVMALDNSNGADGIVANKAIDSFESLKGKKVGLETGGGASYFWFLYLLHQHGMSLQDIDVNDMSARAAGAAFAAGQLDAAVTWQPWLTTADQRPFGHTLITSKATPGVIADTLGFRRDFVEQHPQRVQAVVNAVFDAMAYTRDHQQAAYAIMAKAMGQTPQQFAQSAEGVRWYDLAMNREYFGAPKQPGPLYELCRQAAALFVDAGVIDHKPEIEPLISARFVQAAAPSIK
ncbi:ABC transporter substrate-binding protein [Salinisphaera sp. SPP-AMP-43]|uniref:ABC transporter substrate-binding protein n=1 Tax=Salinisphaera sp. SPP-AMP-43 TaxID=3121288 RepID=UPI003C6DBF06